MKSIGVNEGYVLVFDALKHKELALSVGSVVESTNSRFVME